MSECDNVRRLLALLVRGELSDAASRRVRAHIETCSACRAEAEALDRLARALDENLRGPAVDTEKEVLSRLGVVVEEPVMETGLKKPMFEALRWAAVAAAFVVAALLLWPGGKGPVVLPTPTCEAAEALRTRFAKHYEPVELKVKPAIPQYELPLNLSDVDNWPKVARFVTSDAARALIKKNGFVVVPYTSWKGREDVVEFYKALKAADVPVLVTADALLHLYHIQFDTTLKEIEEREFYRDIRLLTDALFEHFRERAGAAAGVLKEVNERNAAFLGVARILLEGAPLLEETDTASIRKAVAQNRAWKHAEKLGRMKDALLGLPPGVVDERERAKLAKLRAWQVHRAAGQILTTYENTYRRLKKEADEVRKETLEALPAKLREAVEEELRLIEEHSGFAKSPLFVYKEDYSQYVPRGHYTRSELLKCYFKALMWYGRITMLLKGGTPYGPAAPYLVPADVARKQTLQACLISGALDLKASDGRTVSEIWERIYSVTAYYVGLADDLTPYEYRENMEKVFGERMSEKDLLDEKKFFEFKKLLALLRRPEIYSGTGACMGPPAGIASAADLDRALAKTQGLRLMGQRYIPDSFMMGQLVYPTVGPYTGGRDPKPFTFVASGGGPIRGFPRGLDVMAVLGSERALEILKKEGDADYVGYFERVDKKTGRRTGLKPLREQFGKLTEKDFNRNLYWSWLWVLKGLLKEPKDYRGCQSFQQTAAWTDKQLNAALGSWSQLRHDTILYAKQSYTMEAGCAPLRPKPVSGYVEPEPEFFTRLLALTRMTLKGLDEMKVLSENGRKRLQGLEQLLKRLCDILLKEMKNEELSDQDDKFLREFAAHLKTTTVGADDDAQKTTIIADVHTDQNSRMCLEEGTGHIRAAVVVCKLPGGGLQAFVGPAFSYYEFKHPMSDRLTDEAWRKMLKKDAPPLPEWTSSFAAK